MKNHSYYIWIYAALLLIGGFIGFIKAGSLMSILMATGFAILLFGCGYAVWKGSWIAYQVAIGLLSLLLIFFGYRFLTTYQAMPSGMMTLLTLILLAPLARNLYQIKNLSR
jgi:uncharacterized membrane protein (UPF0136 family)